MGFILWDGGSWRSYICDADYQVNCRPNDYFNETVLRTIPGENGAVTYYYSDSHRGVRTPHVRD